MSFEKRKIAIFTDARALLEPTKAILDDIKCRGITEIYSLGDNIGVGPNPSEVIDLLKENNSNCNNSKYTYIWCLLAAYILN